ncbi:hypothetical protein TrCOL_g10729 [Triparma columacea]|uniref:Uncharacterized protein n=1 Tax=Triparma columacea TaxID=722753 RepID=A0A9W7G4D4_9STRA|nr:hypothetical protein TrCOL_g10729 [Triparma columacea]
MVVSELLIKRYNGSIERDVDNFANKGWGMVKGIIGGVIREIFMWKLSGFHKNIVKQEDGLGGRSRKASDSLGDLTESWSEEDLRGGGERERLREEFLGVLRGGLYVYCRRGGEGRYKLFVMLATRGGGEGEEHGMVQFEKVGQEGEDFVVDMKEVERVEELGEEGVEIGEGGGGIVQVKLTEEADRDVLLEGLRCLVG